MLPDTLRQREAQMYVVMHTYLVQKLIPYNLMAGILLHCIPRAHKVGEANDRHQRDILRNESTINSLRQVWLICIDVLVVHLYSSHFLQMHSVHLTDAHMHARLHIYCTEMRVRILTI